MPREYAAVMLRNAVPGLMVLRHYERSWLRSDLLAGITVAAYLIPQVMAYAAIAGLPPVAGLWACVGPLLVYAIFGSSRQLSIGPEATTALMTGIAVSAALGPASDPKAHAGLAAALAILTGLVCVVAYIARLGFLAGLLSRPVLVGYLAGVAVLMIISQLGRITGLEISGEHAWQELASFFDQLGQANLASVAVAAAVVLALFAFRHWLPTWPGPLLVMLAAAAVVRFAGLGRFGIEVIGAVPSGLPALVLPDFAGLDWGRALPAAVGIAIVGYTDSALTGRGFAARHRQRIDTNQEFLALGLANITAGLGQGFPVSSSGSRTALADSMGSKSQLYSLVALVTVVASMLWLGPVLATFPRAALGGVVIYAALRLVDVAQLRRLARFRTSELGLALITAAAVVGLDVLTGIGVAVGLSVLDLLRRIGAPEAAVLGYVPGLAGMHDIKDYPKAEQVPGLIVFRYDSPVFFANAENFRRRALATVADASGPVDWFVVNFEAITTLDLTAIDALQELHDELAERKIMFGLARVKQETREELERAGVITELDAGVFPTLPTAVVAYIDWVTARDGVRPAWADSLPINGSASMPVHRPEDLDQDG